MSVFGVVCEYNPFHKGHKYLLDAARELGADRVVCVMSGNSVQRGEFAVADKYIRAEAAAREGADLVLELPFPWCSASAEYFARASVGILSELCDTLIFGSECGDIDLLCRVAETADSDSFRAEYKQMLSEGRGSAEAYFSLLKEMSGYELSSNDLLGVEYIRAIRRTDSKMIPLTVKRQGSGYLDSSLEGAYPSATAIRKAWREAGVDRAREHIPPAAFEVYRRAEREGNITDTSFIDSAVVSFFRLASGDSIEGFAETGGGIGGRLCSVARESVSYEELVEKAKTKRYTDSKLRRAILFSMAGVSDEMLKSDPEYTTLLAANGKGREILSANRKNQGLRIITKGADSPRDSAQFKVTERLDALFTLARENRAEASAMLKKNITIID